jgi:ribonuclease HI
MTWTDILIPKDHPHWKRMRFKGNKVWMAVNANQSPLLERGKALIKYQLDQPHEYWVLPSKILPLDDGGAPARRKATGSLRPPAPRHSPESPVTPQACDKAVCIYTDGACSGNPGPAGIGIVLRYQGKSKEISRYLGRATNNIAELEAIRVGLMAIKNRDLPVIVFTDSNYAFGLLTRGWKAKLNTALVEEIRSLMSTFKRLQFVKVKGHAGHPENEHADRLAVKAIQQQTRS